MPLTKRAAFLFPTPLRYQRTKPTSSSNPLLRQRLNLLQTRNRIRTSMCCFLTLHQEVLEEEVLMLIVRVEMMRRQHSRDDRHFGFQLHLHQAADDSLRYE